MDTYEGIPVASPYPSGLIQAPENIKHYYGILNASGTELDPDPDGTYRLQVTTVSPDANGVMPPLPPPQYQAPGMVVSSGGGTVNWPEPHVVFDSSGVCTTAGNAPGPVWYNVGDQSGSPSTPGGPGTGVPSNPIAVAYQAGYAAGFAAGSK